MTGTSETAAAESVLTEQAALRRLALMVARDTPAATLFDRVCEELGRALDVKSTDVVRFDDDGRATVVGAWAATGAPSFPIGERIPIDAGTVTGLIYETGLPQRVDDYRDLEGELAARLREQGIRSVVGAPISVAGRMWGGIMVTSADAGSFPPETERRIADFAELVTAALANADAREKLAASRARIVAAADDARRRIERDLHDGAQQRLVSLALNLSLLESRANEGGDVTAGLATARAELEQALQELRELARGIHPSLLSDRGLTAALEALAKRAPMPVDLDVDAAGDRIPRPLQTTAYFIVSEALTNCARYADCERAVVRVEIGGEELVVEVRDDGAGGASVAAGSGLRGLADRVTALDGEFALISEPGAGTLIRARIPLCACDGYEAERAAEAAEAAQAARM